MTKENETSSPKLHQEISGTSLLQILAGLKSPDKRVKGRALELLAIHFTRLIDLDFRGWILRSVNSNGIEVGVVACDRQVPFNHWLIQCRNARQMDMGDIATAVGRGVSLRPSIVLSVTTGSFTRQAHHYAARAMQLTNLHILLIDAHDLRAIANDETRVKSILSREAGQAKSIKEAQLTPFCA